MHTLPRAWRTLNTDFPNYYMAARLVHEGYDTSRMYEWAWIEREKDHRAVDTRVIGLVSVTPFSTLAAWPLTGLTPLTAKHIWILLNLAFLIPIGWILRSITGLGSRRVALILFLSFPLHRNLLYGQFYVLLLLLISGACFCYLRRHRSLAGGLLAVAAVCKVFPLILFIFFLQRRDWRALIAGVTTGISAVVVSIAAFGLNAHRNWLQEQLPWIMRGDWLGAYASSASISGVLHRLFLSEPQWNPHPWHNSPLCYALLAPTLQMLALAPAILLIRRDDESKERVLLEWSALLTASLTISTIPASYTFVLMVFPVCVLAAILLRQRRYGWLAALVFAYLGIGFPVSAPSRPLGLVFLLYVPRLPLMMAVLFGTYALMWNRRRESGSTKDWSRYVWGVGLTATVILSARSTLRVQRAERQEYAYRVPLQAQGFLSSGPQSTADGIRYAAFTFTGYHLVMENQGKVSADSSIDAPYDDLSFTSGYGHVLVERASSSGSQIVDLNNPSEVVIEDAHEPMLSEDGQTLAFVRDNHGRGRLMVRRRLESSNTTEVALTPIQLNVYEASFLSEKEYAFSATEDGHLPQIYWTDAAHVNTPISLEASRYPALSPDGRWMAYSHLDHGVWNLWIRNRASGAIRRVADVPCNQIQPAWESDSQTLLYGTDCGRSVWFTAVARRKVIP
ncbi:WD40-like beta Propeller containing protein [Terriglobus saanensis SP1PR4]|uniref:WD40-like beta Propeller containing protein n=1 Tax=Terriglobus saanensis (strain ATCC BAA-1853 / DSM 23119 / SP1PR4) TaxID=401053 RepID=E8V147_TERSS|nr:WD40-like beta Propeller containing protein [Terriglobus saanensis SP1PR4]